MLQIFKAQNLIQFHASQANLASSFPEIQFLGIFYVIYININSIGNPIHLLSFFSDRSTYRSLLLCFLVESKSCIRVRMFINALREYQLTLILQWTKFRYVINVWFHFLWFFNSWELYYRYGMTVLSWKLVSFWFNGFSWLQFVILRLMKFLIR